MSHFDAVSFGLISYYLINVMSGEGRDASIFVPVPIFFIADCYCTSFNVINLYIFFSEVKQTITEHNEALPVPSLKGT